MAAVAEQLIARRSASAADWATSPVASVQAIAPAQWLAGRKRIVIVSPHPNDETLGAGGTLALAAELGVPMHVVAVTDGEASRRGGDWWTSVRLRRERRRESWLGMTLLGATRCTWTRCRIPDGAVAAHERELMQRLLQNLSRDDLAVTTWSLDGHSDHEATARAVHKAARIAGAAVREFPLWGWHWANPYDDDLPLDRCVRVPLSADALARKRLAIAACRTQVAADPASGRAPVLSAAMLANFTRAYEVFVV